MKAVQSALVLAATFCWLVLLLAAQPFDHFNLFLDRCFGALPPWTQVENLYKDPATQEVTRGGHPLQSFAVLGQAWGNNPQIKRLVLMGNSQTMAVSLAPGEMPSAAPEMTYPDLLAGRLRSREVLFYRLSAGGMSYEEMLWYTLYISHRPQLKPSVLIIQLNYQNLVNAGIREDMPEMLSDPEFRSRIESLARSESPFAEEFAGALHRFDEKVQQSASGADSEGRDSLGVGEVVEAKVRAQVQQKVPGFVNALSSTRRAFFAFLYRARIYFLGLTPATKRSINVTRLSTSRACLEKLIEVAQAEGIRVVLFQAPTNPKVPLYRTREDNRIYHALGTGLAEKFNLILLDFERSIPEELWGMELNRPDPLHLSRRGHQMFASLFERQLDSLVP